MTTISSQVSLVGQVAQKDANQPCPIDYTAFKHGGGEVASRMDTDGAEVDDVLPDTCCSPPPGRTLSSLDSGTTATTSQGQSGVVISTAAAATTAPVTSGGGSKSSSGMRRLVCTGTPCRSAYTAVTSAFDQLLLDICSFGHWRGSLGN
jgi:hypothetical protein